MTIKMTISATTMDTPMMIFFLFCRDPSEAPPSEGICSSAMIPPLYFARMCSRTTDRLPKAAVLHVRTDCRQGVPPFILLDYTTDRGLLQPFSPQKSGRRREFFRALCGHSACPETQFAQKNGILPPFLRLFLPFLFRKDAGCAKKAKRRSAEKNRRAPVEHKVTPGGVP